MAHRMNAYHVNIELLSKHHVEPCRMETAETQPVVALLQHLITYVLYRALNVSGGGALQRIAADNDRMNRST